MVGQQKISQFFKTSAATMAPKRKSTASNAESPKKAQKTEPTLSPEQQQRVESKRREAIEKLGSKITPTSMGDSWKEALKDEFTKPYFMKLVEFVESERRSKTVYPPEKDVYSWTNCCDIKNIKVVILGQDPYHGAGQAHGLSFSVPPLVSPPPSLRNMYKELEVDIPDFKTPQHGYLMGWARQGVLLLNACLTVVSGNANSHAGRGWERFTDVVISWINNNLDNVVFMLWGAYAQKKGKTINKAKHLVLNAPHPSPLSAHRGFLGCKHFSKANEYLDKHGKTAVDWSRLPKN